MSPETRAKLEQLIAEWQPHAEKWLHGAPGVRSGSAEVYARCIRDLSAVLASLEAPPPQEPTCARCSHWVRRYESQGHTWATCDAAQLTEDRDRFRFWPVTANDDDAVTTREDFGCVLFQPAEPPHAD